MKRIAILLAVLFIGTSSFSQNKVTADTTGNKTPDTRINEGASGVRRSIGYKFSSLITDTDPGNGVFRCNNSQPGKVTWIYVDNIDISGEDQTNWYSTWDKMTGAAARGSINIVGKPAKDVILFNVTGLFVKADGYWKIPVEYISGNLPAAGATYYYVFNRIAHRKPQPVQEPKPSQEQPVAEAPKPVQEQPVVEVPKPVQEQPVVEAPKPVQEQPVADVPKPVQEQPVAEPPKPVQSGRTAPTAARREAPHPARTTQSTQPAKTEPAAQTTGTKTTIQTTEPAQHAQPAQEPPQTGQTTQSVRNAQTYPAAQYIPQNQVARPVDVPNPYADVNLSGSSRRKCYRGIIEIGYAIGLGDYGINNFRFNFINGIMIGRSSSIGLGLGYRRYFENDMPGHTLFSPKSHMPVFLDLRTSFSTRKVTPYLALGIGGSASFVKVNSDSTTTRQEGLYLSPSGGIWFNISDRFAVFAGIAYEIQRLEYVLIADDSHFRKNAGSISLNIGIAF